MRAISLCCHLDLTETASPIGSARFAKSSRGTGQVLFFPLALRGKAFGFSVLQEHAVMTPVIRIFFVMLIVRYLSIHISIKSNYHAK